MPKKTQTIKIVRDARDGRFVPAREAERRPSTTVTETRPKPGKGKK